MFLDEINFYILKVLGPARSHFNFHKQKSDDYLKRNEVARVRSGV